MTKICLNCGHKKGSHTVYGGYFKDYYDGYYTQCQECDCQEFYDVKDYPKQREWLIKIKIKHLYRDVKRRDEKYLKLTGKSASVQDTSLDNDRASWEEDCERERRGLSE